MMDGDEEIRMHPGQGRQRLEHNKLAKRLRRNVGRAIQDYNMIEQGDRVMVCVSGGKDSHTLLDVLLGLKRSAPVDFDVIAVTLDQGQPGFPEHVLPAYFREEGVPYEVIEQDTYSVVKRVVAPDKTMCGLCSRLRRGALYTYARQRGITKIALGHHRDDILETLFLNLFYGGRLKAMPAKLLSDDARHVLVRPLAYCKEADIERYAAARAFPIIPCRLCGSQDNLQRAAIKKMLRQWDKESPGRLETMFKALTRVVPSHLADPELFDFRALGAAGAVDWLRRAPACDGEAASIGYNAPNDASERLGQ